MDNPWAENWDESDKKNQELDQPTTSIASSSIAAPTWTSPAAPTAVQSAEDDIATATWTTTSSSVAWTEPDTETIGWGKTPAFESTWEPEPIPFGDQEAVPDLHHSGFSGKDSTPSSPSLSNPVDEVSTPPSPVLPSTAVPIPVVPEEVDGFGSFATGDEGEDNDNAWGPTSTFAEPANAEDDVWGNSWEEPRDDADENDEWEVAKQEKEKQDRHVPPERLNAILSEFENVASELWPDGQVVDDERGRVIDLDSVVSHSVRLALVPEGLTLSMPKPFQQTFAAKRESEALKLSRNAIVTRKGPMAMYMATKGSISWEASVIARADSSSTDAAPAGWKIIPKDEQVVEDTKQKRNTGGGILSFFSRRAASTPVSDDAPRPSRPASPAKSITKVSSPSPRVSVDTTSTSTPPAASTSAVSVAASASPAANLKPIKTNASPTTALDFFPTPATEEPKETPSPSVVSRFFGRFSRTRSSNGRDSLALSTDDLEFLADVVPTTQASASQDDQLKALTTMINSQAPSLPAALPPPLAPPPRPTQMKRQTLPTQPTQQKTTAEEDLFSLFDAPAPTDTAASHSNKQSQPLPSIPPSDPFSLLNNSTSFASSSNLSFGSTVGSPSSTLFSAESKSSISSFSGARMSSPSLQPPLPPPKSIPAPASSSNSMSPATSRAPSPANLHQTTQPMSSTIAPLPPPPTSLPRTPIPTSSIPTLPPPPSSRSHTPSLIPNVLANPSIPEVDDDFDDFVTSPAGPTAVPSLSFSTFNAPNKPTNPTNSLGNGLMDDFGDFGSFSAAPDPPVAVPAVHPTATVPIVPRAASSSPRQSRGPSTSPSKRVSRADHQRTLSLMESASSRAGTWLSPPSPLPMALPPPEARGGKPKDPFETGIFASQQSMPPPSSRPPSIPPPPTNNKATPTSSWSFPPPPMSNGASQVSHSSLPMASTAPAPPSFNLSSTFSNFDAPVLAKPTPPPQPPAMSSSSSSGKGGLSAQDLAFFEGL
ncbi:hypothetical protein CC1G_00974 [Coprinopsis cinerea okayama7|uniref:Uncharacterized protein n=1 Tax=Coprinopsis cinerea (strain Okayama-7 / 130 / ATCC MYA-4618 / FGSC 9003) TaxID=240176 RepID=A8N999_COPC7|nr:hypothetical protein CC1G_00974 [Coprinopsis cinerea okayama7\|eukprot:XP_001831427.2 hypothetical protein CC1G_00974 [Coprinopsis cinerea okayama7\